MPVSLAGSLSILAIRQSQDSLAELLQAKPAHKPTKHRVLETEQSINDR